MTPRAYLWFFAIVALWATLALAWPAERPNIQWHQTCLYAMSPDTLEAIGKPANICDREFYDI
jgi:hypothetical protein